MKLKENIFEQLEGKEVNILPVMNITENFSIDEADLPQTLPILTLRGAVVFPQTIVPIMVSREKSLKLVKALFNSNKIIGTNTQEDISIEDPHFENLHKIGCSAKILKIIELPDGSTSVILRGMKRYVLNDVIANEPYLIGNVSYINDIIPPKEDKHLKAATEAIKEAATYIAKGSPNIPPEATFALRNLESQEFLINYVASALEHEDATDDKLRLLDIDSLKERAYLLLEILNKQISLLKLKENIQQKVKFEMDQQQREYYLNNQLKTIQEELGMGDSSDIHDFEERAAKKDWPEKVAQIFKKEIAKLDKANPNSPDYSVQYNYIDFLLDLPWNHLSQDNLDLKNAQKVLDRDHFGLEKVKERIIEYLAVLKLRGDMKSPILCLYGPPGVGKTSLGKSIAKALGREYGRVSLGGLHDEAEIRGHRKTYIGAMAGRILDTIRKCGTSNPVIVLDEIDKVSSDYKGDPASALLEVLDPEQNTAFHDNYLDIDYDLSKVMFITTANDISTIHPALKDRMELIAVDGYLPEEKLQIAKKYLIPKQMELHGLARTDFNLNKKAIETIISSYTRESGVRTLDKMIAKVARNIAKRKATYEYIPLAIADSDVREILGLPTNFHDLQEGNEAPGVVTGLAWTQVGGEILFVECSLSQGKGELTTTGNLGDVMKESVMIAYQYIKSHSDLLGLDPKVFQEKNVHIHVPEGAIPKDGPSAGITMVSAMASAFTGKAVRHAIAMTGEMTLRGKVLPVGGIKEKILAAKRAGVTTIILSADNERDIKEIKDIYVKGVDFVYVKTMDQVLKFIFS